MQDHGSSVLRLALSQTGSKADAEDIYQDVFVSLACSNKDFADEDHLHAWLLRVTLNRCRDLMRSWWRRHTQQLDDYEINVAMSEAPREPLSSDRETLWAAVRKLPERYRVVVHLRYVEDMSVEEIASMCAISPSAVRARLSRAHQKMRAFLGDDYE